MAERGRLHVVAVPIGNLEDITLRALRVLREVDLVACEDTRRTGQLFDLLGVPSRPLVAVHDHNERARAERIVAVLAEGKDVALVSDAGTPTINDPGYALVRAVVDAGFEVVSVPGPCAVITALAGAGLPTDRFRFLGFPPAKVEARRQAFEEVAGARETLVYYVAPHDLVDTLEAASTVFGGDRPAVVARELTKKFEEFRRGTLASLVAEPGVVRGEVVLLVGGAPEEAPPTADDLDAAARAVIADGFTGARAAKELARRTGISREEAYRVVLAARGER